MASERHGQDYGCAVPYGPLPERYGFPDPQLRAGTLLTGAKSLPGRERAEMGSLPTPLGLTVTLRLKRTSGSIREVGAWKGDFHRPWRDASSQAPIEERSSSMAASGEPERR